MRSQSLTLWSQGLPVLLVTPASQDVTVLGSASQKSIYMKLNNLCYSVRQCWITESMVLFPANIFGNSIDTLVQQNSICSDAISLRFLYRTCTVPRRHINAFPKMLLSLQWIRIFWYWPRLAGFAIQICYTEVDRPSLADSAVISDVIWFSMKLTKPGSREPFQKSEKGGHLLGSIVQLIMSLKRAVMDPHAGAFTTDVPY